MRRLSTAPGESSTERPSGIGHSQLLSLLRPRPERATVLRWQRSPRGFVRVRLLDVGPVVEKKEWVQFIGSLVILVLGTINVRMAAMRERRRKGLRN